MISSLLLSIKQSVNKAYRLRKPKRAALEAFKSNLIHLLSQINEKESREKVEIYLMNILQETYFAPDYQEPANSSPVCYAHVPGLREGFTEPFLTAPETLAQSDNKLLPGTSLTNHFTINAYLREAVYAIKHGVRQIIIATKQVNPPADNPDLEKQIGELVYQLYELTPEEIASVEGK